jgi:Domain of unknown function (DUF6602)
MLYVKENAAHIISTDLDRPNALSGIKHPYLKGKTSKRFIKDVLRPFTPHEFGIRSGKLIDHLGNESPEIDVIVYWKIPLPSVAIDRETSLVPVESVVYIFEVKTRLRTR